MPTFQVVLFLPYTIKIDPNIGKKKAEAKQESSAATAAQSPEQKPQSSSSVSHHHSASLPGDIRRLSAPGAISLSHGPDVVVSEAPGIVPTFGPTWPFDPSLKPLAKLRSATNLSDLARTDLKSPVWGRQTQSPYFVQPASRAKSPPPASVLRHNEIDDEAPDHTLHSRANRYRINYTDAYDPDTQFKVEPSVLGNAGLFLALTAATERGLLAEKIWVGTLGMPTNALSDGMKSTVKERLAVDYESLAVFVDDSDFAAHYEQYCKTILWPHLHYDIPDQPKSKAYEDHSWNFYVRVNQAFADEVIKNWKRGDVIWVHDYHLMLVPDMIRAKLPDAEIGFFMHSSFPSSEIFRCLPTRVSLIKGLLGANLVAFHTQEYAHHFLQTCSRLLPVESTGRSVILEDGRVVDTAAAPLGIHPIFPDKLRQTDEVKACYEQFKARLRDKYVIIARDKLDNTRGVCQKLEIFYKFLEMYPTYAREVVLIQIATTQKGVKSSFDKVSMVLQKFWMKYSSLDQHPVVFQVADASVEEWSALMSLAHCLMVTSLREGMNLTGHDFVVCQDGLLGENKHGPLLLSEYTGAISVLKSNAAVVVNPFDYKQGANAILQALTMDPKEKQERWENLSEAVHKHDAITWFKDITNSLNQAHKEHAFRDITAVPRCSPTQVKQKYDLANRRLLLLDYEGTLVHCDSRKEGIPQPSEQAKEVLEDLVRDKKNYVYIMSSFSKLQLHELFPAESGVGLIAENGSFLRHAGDLIWTGFCDDDTLGIWKKGVRQILDYYQNRIAGSHVDERETCMFFKYDGAEDVEAASKQGAAMAHILTDVCSRQNIHAVPIERGFYIHDKNVNKSVAAGRLISDQFSSRSSGLPDFVLVVGDSREDEYVFDWAAKMAGKGMQEHVTVAVGQRNTGANCVITQGPTGVISTLRKLLVPRASSNSPTQSPRSD